jgi:cell division protein FtsZ
VRVTVIAAGFEGGQPPRRLAGVSRQADLRATLQRSSGGSETAGIAPVTVNGERQPVSVAAVPGSQPAGAGSGLGGPSTNDGGNGHSPVEPPAPTPFRPPAASQDDDDLDIPDFLK